MDGEILIWVNGFAAQSETFDKFVALVANSPLIKGVPVAVLFLFLWFLPRVDMAVARARLIALLALSIVAIAVGRVAAMLLPFRLRPLHAETLDLRLPLSVTRDALDGWSSLPSDHAVLFATLATGFWIVNRWAGLIFALHALLVVAFARVFLMFHYPSDILGGAVIGLAVGLVLMRPLTALVQRSGLVDTAGRWPQYFHPLLFVLLFQIVTMFSSARQLVAAVAKVLI
jgi:undecaprenyl-diphosphatase